MANLLVPPAPVPSIARAAGNALAMRGVQENIRGNQTRNALAEKQLGSYDADQEAIKKQQELQNEARAISTALKAGNTAQASQIYKSLGGISEIGIDIVGNDVSIDYGNSTIKGPSGPVSELMEQVGIDPTWMTDPGKAAKSRAWMAARGISFEMKDPKQTPAEKLSDQKALEKYKADLKSKDKTEKYKVVGGRLVDVSGDSPKIVIDSVEKTGNKTLLDMGLVKVGNSLVDVSDPKNPKAIIDIESKDKTGEPSKEKALKRISDIQKSIATLEKTDMVTALLAKDNPELAQLIGQKIDPEMKASLMDAWNNELDYMEQFSGTKRKKETISPSDGGGGGVTHTFVPGKGLVPVGK